MFIFSCFVSVALDPQHSNRSWVLRDQAPNSMNLLWTVSGVNWTKSLVDWISMALHRKPVAPAGNKWAEAETELVAMLPVTTRSTSNSWALVRALLWISALLADHWLTSQVCKVENISKGSLDLIPSPSPEVKIQITGGKVGLSCKGKTLIAMSTVLDKKFVDNAHQCCADKNKTKNSNVHDSLKEMGSNPGYLLKSSLLYVKKSYGFHFFFEIRIGIWALPHFLKIECKSAFVFKAAFCTIFNWQNLVVPSANFQANLCWGYHQIWSIEEIVQNSVLKTNAL